METSPAAGIERPNKQFKNNSWNPHHEITSETNYASNLLSFSDHSNYTSQQLGQVVKPKVEMVCNPKMDNNTSSITLANMLVSQQGALLGNNQNYVFNKACQLDQDKKIETTHPNKHSQSQAHDHIVAERKRREKLSQRFIALSALVPGLKKVPKFKQCCVNLPFFIIGYSEFTAFYLSYSYV